MNNSLDLLLNDVALRDALRAAFRNVAGTIRAALRRDHAALASALAARAGCLDALRAALERDAAAEALR